MPIDHIEDVAQVRVVVDVRPNARLMQVAVDVVEQVGHRPSDGAGWRGYRLLVRPHGAGARSVRAVAAIKAINPSETRFMS